MFRILAAGLTAVALLATGEPAHPAPAAPTGAAQVEAVAPAGPVQVGSATPASATRAIPAIPATPATPAPAPDPADRVLADTPTGPSAPAPEAGGVVAYRKPIDAPISDPFRPPATRYGPGNRGVEFATSPGQVIVAMADGRVVFAGQVGGTLHVVVLHADGIRTSYSYLAEILVQKGQVVQAATPVGRTGTRVHVGARRGDVYIDPAALWSARRLVARLVPDDPERPLGQHDRGGGQ